LGLDGEKVFSPEKVIKRKLEETGYLLSSFYRPSYSSCRLRVGSCRVRNKNRLTKPLLSVSVVQGLRRIMPTLSNYKELKAFLEKEQPDWIRALIPRQSRPPAVIGPKRF